MQANNLNIVKKIKFPDHYKYSEKELKNLIYESKKNNLTLLTTEKDYFRIDEEYKKNISFLKISINIEEKEKLIEEIKKII